MRTERAIRVDYVTENLWLLFILFLYLTKMKNVKNIESTCCVFLQKVLALYLISGEDSSAVKNIEFIK